MSEKSATKTLIRAFKKIAPACHIQRIEDKYSSGVPDLNICIFGDEIWLEGKFRKALPVKDTTRIKFGAKDEKRLHSQRNWLEARDRAGGYPVLWCYIQGAGWMYWTDNFSVLTEGVSKEVFLLYRFPNSMAMVKDMLQNHRNRLRERVWQDMSFENGIKYGRKFPTA